MPKKNCWEYMKCGRQPGGEKVKELGVCCAYLQECLNGINGGFNGCRACWAIAGTLCGGKIQGSYEDKFRRCMTCEFYNLVLKEEGPDFISSRIILQKLEENK